MNQLINQIAPIIVVLIVLVFVAFRSKTTHFECPMCGCKFKVSGLAFALAPHMAGSRLATCPDCGHRGMMPPINDEK